MELQEPTKCFIFFSLIWNSKYLNEKEVLKIYPDFIDTFSPAFNPSLRYYSKEMGNESDLKRIIIFNSKTYTRESLVRFKLEAQELEVKFLNNYNQRIINIDPGLISLENMILSTSKNFSHRLYLGQKIFGNLELIFEEGRLKKLPWSYDDYASEEKIEFFMWLRSRLQAVLA